MQVTTYQASKLSNQLGSKNSRKALRATTPRKPIQVSAVRTSSGVHTTGKGTRSQKNQEQDKVERNNVKNHFQNIINTLLFRAASRRERGVATCLECKGSGYKCCPDCKGSGVCSPMNRDSLTHMAQNNTALHGKGDQWLMTNRCKRCRGQGHITCETCEGSGLRTPMLVPGIASTTNLEEDCT